MLKVDNKVKKRLIYAIFVALIFAGFIIAYRYNSVRIGEFFFLRLHQNNIALHILKQSNSDNFYKDFLLGRILFVENKLPESVYAYDKAIEKNPLHKESYYGRGLSYGFMGGIFLDDAEKDFEKYIEIDNLEFEKTGKHAYGAWAGYNDLAWIHFLQGDFKNMEEATKRGLGISVNSPWLNNMMGVALLAQKKCNDATFYLNYSKKLLEKTTSKQFGEAYSGDNPDFWAIGKKQMEDSINENLKICLEIAQTSFPQKN